MVFYGGVPADVGPTGVRYTPALCVLRNEGLCHDMQRLLVRQTLNVPAYTKPWIGIEYGAAYLVHGYLFLCVKANHLLQSQKHARVSIIPACLSSWFATDVGRLCNTQYVLCVCRICHVVTMNGPDKTRKRIAMTKA